MRRTNLHRWWPLFAPLLALAAVPSCSSTSSDSTDGGSDAQAGADANADAAACMLLASSFDDSCTVPSDCESVPAGGNIRDPCTNSVGALTCPFGAALNASGAAAFRAQLLPALSALRDPSAPTAVRNCVLGGCPTAAPATCEQGKCVVGYADASSAADDASSGDALPACPDLMPSSGCTASRTVLSCARGSVVQMCDSDNATSCPGTDGGAVCITLCSGDEFAVDCSGALPAGCRALSGGPSGGTSGCCPCADYGDAGDSVSDSGSDR